MKHKVAITIEPDILRWIDGQVKTGKFRNRSHGLEYCVRLAKERKFL